jgi:hypothetical protein
MRAAELRAAEKKCGGNAGGGKELRRKRQAAEAEHENLLHTVSGMFNSFQMCRVHVRMVDEMAFGSTSIFNSRYMKSGHFRSIPLCFIHVNVQ